jgi:hypothetical protein
LISIYGTALIIAIYANGGGQHSWDVSPEQNLMNLRIYFARSFFYMWSITMVKVSVALFFMRFATRRLFTRFLQVSIILLLTSTFCLFFAILLQCNPVDAAWNKSITEAHCYPTQTNTDLWYIVNGKFSSNFLNWIC